PQGLSPHTGPLASAAWLLARELHTHAPRWSVTVAFDMAEGAIATELDLAGASRFQIEIFAEEWGFRFCHQGRVSWIRVTDIAFVHGRDDHELLRQTPALRDIGKLLRALECRHDLVFRRDRALIATTLPGAEPAIMEWSTSL
ncbi:MAG TPA: hypothetical protein VFB62_23675, partial [Polyangiaceae bacterium]|nr:hypothetical protein [Polyangiaceae bacterium]